jgi:hypothetical protein
MAEFELKSPAIVCSSHQKPKKKREIFGGKIIQVQVEVKKIPLLSEAGSGILTSSPREKIFSNGKSSEDN